MKLYIKGLRDIPGAEQMDMLSCDSIAAHEEIVDVEAAYPDDHVGVSISGFGRVDRVMVLGTEDHTGDIKFEVH